MGCEGVLLRQQARGLVREITRPSIRHDETTAVPQCAGTLVLLMAGEGDS